jgi:ABC-type multidrug transport system ATPase subunit
MRVQDKCILEVADLSFGFKPRNLFSGLNWKAPAGVSLIQGGEGVGKTTLLRLLAGDLLPESGSITAGNFNFSKDPALYRQSVFRTDARSEAFDALTCSDFFGHWADRYSLFNARLATELAVHLGLEDHLAKPLYMLSTGSKRKLWQAAAFASGAVVTLLDEPFAALDHRSVQRVLDLLLEATHNNQRSFVVADYTPPPTVPLASVLDLGN